MNSSKGNKEVDNGSEEKYVDSAEASHKTKLGSSLDPNDHSIRKCQIAHMPKRDEKDASKSSADFILANPISIGDIEALAPENCDFHLEPFDKFGEDAKLKRRITTFEQKIFREMQAQHKATMQISSPLISQGKGSAERYGLKSPHFKAERTEPPSTFVPPFDTGTKSESAEGAEGMEASLVKAKKSLLERIEALSLEPERVQLDQEFPLSFVWSAQSHVKLGFLDQNMLQDLSDSIYEISRNKDNKVTCYIYIILTDSGLWIKSSKKIANAGNQCVKCIWTNSDWEESIPAGWWIQVYYADIATLPDHKLIGNKDVPFKVRITEDCALKKP